MGVRPRHPASRARSRLSDRRRPAALAVLCSGHGTNLQAIINAIHAGRLRARIAVVISDQPRAGALIRARRVGIPAVWIDPERFADRRAFDRHLITLLTASRVRVVCLAGFLRILSPAIVRRFRNRLLNIHPALLPAFPGAHAIRDALTWGVKVTGVTVHLVDEHVDHGPILLQEAVAIKPRDTAGTLLARLHRIEHRLYPKAIQLVLDGRVKVRGRLVSLH